MRTTKVIPSPWAQAFPRAIGLEPDGFLVPAATLRHLLARENPPNLIYTGFAFNPWLPNGGRFRARRDADPQPGDLIICEVDGWADLRRVVGRRRDGALVTALDAYPEGRAIVPGPAVMGIVTGIPGAGGEALHLARAGYRVTGVDFSPAMVEEARENARATGLEIEFLEADIVTLDLAGRKFEAIYATPLVYSFIARRERRLAALRRLGRHLEGRGLVIFSAALYRGPLERLQAFLGRMNRRPAGPGFEIGDWYTRFLTAQGRIGTSFLRLFSPREIVREARLAGFERIDRMGRAHFIAAGFRNETA